MNFTYLYESGRWFAAGDYYDADDRHFALKGETELIRTDGRWTLGGFLEVQSDPPQRFQNDYVIAQGESPCTLAWRSFNPAFGTLRGTFELVGNAIVSNYRSEDGVWSGVETMRQLSDDTCDSVGVAYQNGRRLSSWSVVVKRR